MLQACKLCARAFRTDLRINRAAGVTKRGTRCADRGARKGPVLGSLASQRPTYGQEPAVKLDALEQTARARNIDLSVHRIASGAEIAAAIDMAQASGAAALNVLASPMLHANRQLIMDRVATLRLPTMYQWPETAEEGGFVSYGPRLIDLFGVVLTPTTRPALPRHQGCRHPGRTTDQVRASDQPQDRQCA